MTTATCDCGATYSVPASGPGAQANVDAQLAQHRRAGCPLAGHDTKRPAGEVK